jgi:hypothetical protein
MDPIDELDDAESPSYDEADLAAAEAEMAEAEAEAEEPDETSEDLDDDEETGTPLGS